MISPRSPLDDPRHSKVWFLGFGSLIQYSASHVRRAHNIIPQSRLGFGTRTLHLRHRFHIRYIELFQFVDVIEDGIELRPESFDFRFCKFQMRQFRNPLHIFPAKLHSVLRPFGRRMNGVWLLSSA
jgi:hypothetical protein